MRISILERCLHHHPTSSISTTSSSSSSQLLLLRLRFGPFNSSTQRRWKKPTDSAQTRLENRTIDLKLDNLTSLLRTLSFVLQTLNIFSTRRRRSLASSSRTSTSTTPFVSVQSMSRWNNLIVGLNVGIPQFLRKYPHVFDLFTHPVSRSLCCQITPKMRDLVKEEDHLLKVFEFQSVMRLKKLLMLSRNATLHVHALRLIRRELGLPVDFRDSILAKHTNVFKLIDLELVQLIDSDDDDEKLSVAAEIEKWREKEYTEKWLSEFETKYAFPIHLPTGFKMERGFREELKNWQRLQYLKPYEDHKKKAEVVRVRSCGGVERFEKRAVGILHELLSLTVEKMVEVERLAHFKKDFGMEVNVRELLLKHPGIFYISTKGNMQLVFLRQAYSKGCLTEPNAIYDVRRKMLDLLLLGCRNTRELQTFSCKEKNKEPGHNHNVVYNEEMGETKAGDWIIPILKNCQQNFDDNWVEISDSSK